MVKVLSLLLSHLLLCSTSLIYAYADNQCKYLTIPICDEQQSISQAVQAVTDRESSGQRQMGSPGKRGPVGPPGPKGEKGDQGYPGTNGRNISGRVVEEMLEMKVQERLSKLVPMTGTDFCKTAPAGVHSVFGELYVCDGNGWTVIQKRVDGSVDFERKWIEYRMGFGNLNENFWIGLDKIHKMVKGRTCQLRMHVETFDGDHGYANYSYFSIGDEGTKFQLTVGGYSGNTGDSFGTFHNGMKFTTIDQDNDMHTANCAKNLGGWWFKNCFRVSFNAQWGRSSGRWTKIIWFSYRGDSEGMKSADMKLRCD